MRSCSLNKRFITIEPSVKMAIEKQIISFILAITFSYLNLIRCEVTEVNLGGPWIVTNANKSISVHGNVPGNVHTALYENGTIMDPYFRFNDVKYRWIAYDNWTYTRSLEGLNIFLLIYLLFDYNRGNFPGFLFPSQTIPLKNSYSSSLSFEILRLIYTLRFIDLI